MPNFTLRPTPGSKVIEALLNEVQGFVESPEYELLDTELRETPGLVCGAFAGYLYRLQGEDLRHGLEARDSRALDDAYRAVEQLAGSTDPEVENLVVTEILENLVRDETVGRAVRTRLGARSKEMFMRWIPRWIDVE